MASAKRGVRGTLSELVEEEQAETERVGVKFKAAGRFFSSGPGGRQWIVDGPSDKDGPWTGIAWLVRYEAECQPRETSRGQNAG